jgi:putative FmdB family regulatory protein
MPIYEYESDSPEGCRVCKKGFELRRPADRPHPTACPVCKGPIRRVLSLPSTPKLTKPLSVSDAKKAGFTVFEKRDKGVYERQ